MNRKLHYRGFDIVLDEDLKAFVVTIGELHTATTLTSLSLDDLTAVLDKLILADFHYK